jgi:hypothetical protein
MSMPSFEESSRVRRSVRVDRRVFDVAGAREMLPLVRSIIADLLDAHACVAMSQRALAAAEQDGADKAEIWRAGDDLSERQKRLTAVQSELKKLGVHLLDTGRGDVGFPTIVNGALAYLVLRGEDDDVYQWRYCDQPRFRPIPKSWYQTQPVRIDETELVIP